MRGATSIIFMESIGTLEADGGMMTVTTTIPRSTVQEADEKVEWQLTNDAATDYFKKNDREYFAERQYPEDYVKEMENVIGYAELQRNAKVIRSSSLQSPRKKDSRNTQPA